MYNTLTNECRILERFYSHVQVRLTYRQRLQNKSPIYEGLYTKTRTKQGCKSSVQVYLGSFILIAQIKT